MHIDEFNENLYPFYAEFGYHASGSLPDRMRETVTQNLSSNPDKAFAIALEHSTPELYFVRLFWRTFLVSTFECTNHQYDQETIPQAVVEATRTYQPPFPPAA